MSGWWSYVLSVIGLVGLWLVGRRNRAGFALGVASQTLWITYALLTRQYGFLLSALAFGYVNARNWWLWRPKATPDP